MSGGLLLLTLCAVLVYCGILQRVLDRMYLTDRQALLLIGLMIAGSFFSDIPLGPVRLNVGGALIPLGICAYLIFKADQMHERLSAFIGSLLTAAAVFAVTKLLPAEAEQLALDPMWIYGASGGIIAWVLGRSRRNAFVCGVVGVTLADMISGLSVRSVGTDQMICLGGAGIADAAVLSGVIGVLLCETLGELIERVARGAFGRRREAR